MLPKGELGEDGARGSEDFCVADICWRKLHTHTQTITHKFSQKECRTSLKCAVLPFMSSRVVYQQRCGSSWLKITISSRISCALSTYCGSIISQHSTHSVEDKESGSTLHSAVKSSVSTLKFKSLAIFIPSAVTNHFWAGLNLVIHFMSRSFQIRSMRISSKMALCLLATLVPSPFLMLRCELMCGFYLLCQKKEKEMYLDR